MREFWMVIALAALVVLCCLGHLLAR